MALFKCKMCGGSLEIAAGTTVIKCEYCGTQQTLPKLDDDKRANMYDRANHFRRNNDFDKAMGIYENILNEDNTDAEAYWSIVLCRYGIEYVDDPATRKRVPTVNRAQFTSIFDDEDYKSAIANADGYQREIYEAEATAINEIQKGILSISQKEEPFDVFICYKESDNNGRRTPDSVLAQDLYYQLKQEGFKVFFSRITLEDKLGSAYEPYIFAALNSAKVMVILGTRPEHFNAVWVKNEWSRYLALIKNGANKTIIPAYRDMDPYDLPEEFSHLQAQDMSKLGFMQDLIRGIKKIAKAGEPKAAVVKETVVTSSNVNIAPLLKRAFMFLEDEDWDSANEYCEKVLDQDPENAQAYLGKLMVELKAKTPDELSEQDVLFDKNKNYQKALRFADNSLKAILAGYIEHINTRNENTRLENIYIQGIVAMNKANSEQSYKDAANIFNKISGYKDADTLIAQCLESAERSRKDAIYNGAIALMNRPEGLINKFATTYCEEAIEKFQSISGWKDADEKIIACQQKIEKLKAQAEAERRKAMNAMLEAEKRAKRNKKIALIVSLIVVAMIAIGMAVYFNAYETTYAWGKYGKYVDKNNIAEFVIPDGVTSIDGYAFYNCAKIESVTIPDSITTIGRAAFYNCENLKYIYYPGSEESWDNINIGEYNDLLKTVTIDYNCNCIHSDVIDQYIAPTCIETGLTEGKHCGTCNEVLVKQTVVNYIPHNYVDGACVVCKQTDAALVAHFEFIELDDGTYSVKAKNHFAIPDKIDIPSQYNGKPVTRIGSYAFNNCSNLTSISIPDSVTSIAIEAFQNCSNITSISIPDSVTSIGIKAFQNCSNLTSIIIPNNVKRIEGSTFSGCSSLTSIIIPDTVQGIGDSAFSNCTSLTNVTIPDGVTSIGNSVFYNCTSLTSISIPSNVTSIGNSVFYNCTRLTNITMPNSMTSIGNEAFFNCISLVSISIPSSVTSIGNHAFFKCTSLTSISIPNSVTSIGDSVFSNCASLTNITMPNSMTSIGNYAFLDCTSLTSISIPDGVTSIGYKVFSGCNSLTSVTIPNSVTSIGASAFSTCSNLTNVTIPDSVTSVGESAFVGCTSLTSVTISNSVTSISSSVFYGCINLKNVILGNNVESIGNNAFYNCTSLTSISIPNSVTSIRILSFAYCTNLKKINYKGTKSQWQAITKNNLWDSNTGNYTVYCTNGTIYK